MLVIWCAIFSTLTTIAVLKLLKRKVTVVQVFYHPTSGLPPLPKAKSLFNFTATAAFVATVCLAFIPAIYVQNALRPRGYWQDHWQCADIVGFYPYGFGDVFCASLHDILCGKRFQAFPEVSHELQFWPAGSCSALNICSVLSPPTNKTEDMSNLSSVSTVVNA